ncbi:CubicO group peptidase, beta-lactamase class C family [Enhydrobacter aerosaccus]|uniref:CubicO group peptidase, beta-lactamase class C family n=1 Tax=Enhydrobacter aerosaccus TaxID=225324 RepID=A0A1T4N7I6_9HYPH|nr:serine hydrolase domain-containing protein [Enhydrobacter aerosaccus]SJZ75056.1 CubicO group peptidase, beta-lactamase class C family [Enhydrobacter aerosaccus]
MKSLVILALVISGRRSTPRHYSHCLGLCVGLVILASFAAFGAPAWAQQQLTADTAATTPAGASFTAPAGWRLTEHTSLRMLEPPEGDSSLVIVDVQAADATAALSAGWKAWHPDSTRPLKIALPQAPYNGWEERHLYRYETSPNEKAVAYALAWRAGSQWTVVVVEASQATFEKRQAQFWLTVGSLRPKGYAREMFAGKVAHKLDAEHIGALQEFVRTAMSELGIPGVGLALLDGGQLVYAGGFGVRALGRPDPVDGDTLFLAASDTKALTTLLLATLADDGKLRWNQPVTEIYPDFRLGDAATTRQVRVRHLVCACTGLPRQDLEWLFNFADATPASSLAVLATMQPTSGFGEVFQYSNPMAAAAGFIGGALVTPGQELGAAYDSAMRQRIFDPLGMTRTTFDFARALADNHASPHDDDLDGKPTVARMDMNYSIVPMRPAGGMWTSARDLARYLALELADGTLPDGRRLVSATNLRERRKPQIQTGEDASYGMGLAVDTRYGIPVISHGGSMFGYKSEMVFLPEHGVGAVVLTNADSGGWLTGLFTRRLLEVLFDGRLEAAEQLKVGAAQRKADRAKWRERLVIPPAANDVSKLAAAYQNEALGRFRVRTQDGATAFDFGPWRSAMASRHNDDGTTSFISIDPTVDGFNFVVGAKDGKRALTVRDGQHEYVFVEAVP